MPVNCCKSGQDQDLLRSLWGRECWKAPLVKLVLYFFGDVRQRLSPYLWKKWSLVSQALEVSTSVSGFPPIAAALHVVPGPFSGRYSARDHPVGSIAFGMDEYWWKVLENEVNIDLDVVLGSPWLPWQAGADAARLCNLSSFQSLPSLSWPIECDFLSLWWGHKDFRTLYALVGVGGRWCVQVVRGWPRGEWGPCGETGSCGEQE